MARLQEHQGKRILMETGLAAPRGEVANSPGLAVQAANLIGYPVAIKAQVPAGGRGKAGGILFADCDDEAFRASRDLLNMTLHGYRVSQVLVEERLEVQREYYLSVFSDPARRVPVVIFSTSGGVDIEETSLQGCPSIAVGEVDILRGVAPYFGIDLVRGLGLSNEEVVELGRIISHLYRVYRQYDCTLAEINPLAVTSKGIIALDARINIDDDSLFRHRELGLDTTEEAGDRRPTELELIAGKIDAHDHRGSTHFVQIDPDGSIAQSQGKVSIGFDGVGTGVSLTTMDELVPLGFFPRNFCDTSGNPTASKLYRITRVILSQPGIEGYVFVSCLSSQQLDNTARGIVKAFKEIYRESGFHPHIPCVFSFRGAWDETAIAIFEEHGLTSSPWVRILGRDSTEIEVAKTFRDLYAQWKEAKKGTDNP